MSDVHKFCTEIDEAIEAIDSIIKWVTVETAKKTFGFIIEATTSRTGRLPDAVHEGNYLNNHRIGINQADTTVEYLPGTTKDGGSEGVPPEMPPEMVIVLTEKVKSRRRELDVIKKTKEPIRRVVLSNHVGHAQIVEKGGFVPQLAAPGRDVYRVEARHIYDQAIDMAKDICQKIMSSITTLKKKY